MQCYIIFFCHQFRIPPIIHESAIEIEDRCKDKRSFVIRNLLGFSLPFMWFRSPWSICVITMIVMCYRYLYIYLHLHWDFFQIFSLVVSYSKRQPCTLLWALCLTCYIWAMPWLGCSIHTQFRMCGVHVRSVTHCAIIFTLLSCLFWTSIIDCMSLYVYDFVQCTETDHIFRENKCLVFANGLKHSAFWK